MSRPRHISYCVVCHREFNWGDCATQYCFEHDPAKKADRAMMAVKRQPGESEQSFLERVRIAGGLPPRQLVGGGA